VYFVFFIQISVSNPCDKKYDKTAFFSFEELPYIENGENRARIELFASNRERKHKNNGNIQCSAENAIKI